MPATDFFIFTFYFYISYFILFFFLNSGLSGSTKKRKEFVMDQVSLLSCGVLVMLM